MVGNSPQLVMEQPVHLPSLINDACRQGVATAVPSCARQPELLTSPPPPSTKQRNEEQPAAEQASRWEQDPAPQPPSLKKPRTSSPSLAHSETHQPLSFARTVTEK